MFHYRLASIIMTSALLTAQAFSAAADLYVSEKGNDANPGTTVEKPLLTLQKADSLVKPGDTVWVMPGTYRNGTNDQNRSASALLTIKTSGTPEAWITYKNYGDTKPELIAQGCWHAINIQASYIVLDGLILTGNNENVTQIAAEKNGEMNVPATLAAWKAEGSIEDVMDYSATPDQSKPAPKPKAPAVTDGAAPAATGDAPAPKPRTKPKSRPVTYEPPSPLYNGNGITVESRGKNPLYHHHVVRNCVVRNFGGGGVNFLSTDYYTLENCEIYNNAWFSRYGCSGFSQLGGREFDQKPGYHNIIRGNRVWEIKGLIRVYYLDLFSDGNGMILDSLGDYGGAVLVENNLSYDNGGSGLHVFKSRKAKIDIVNNTFWRNQQYWRLFDMGAHAATNVHFYNNIVVADKYRIAIGKPDAGIAYDYNIYFGGNDTKPIGPHDQVVDPMFVRPAINRKDSDFSLRPGSPAIGSGTTEFSPKTDLTGNKRPEGVAPSRGAYDVQPTQKN